MDELKTCSACQGRGKHTEDCPTAQTSRESSLIKPYVGPQPCPKDCGGYLEEGVEHECPEVEPTAWIFHGDDGTGSILWQSEQPDPEDFECSCGTPRTGWLEPLTGTYPEEWIRVGPNTEDLE